VSAYRREIDFVTTVGIAEKIASTPNYQTTPEPAARIHGFDAGAAALCELRLR